jgi:iron complex transport system ATP-binding protein
MIEARGVSVRAGGRALLDDVSVAVGAGETVALVGANGAGKSTLMRVLSGELHPDSGEAVLKGRRLASFHPRELAAHRAVMTQSVTVSFPFTIREVVQMGAGERPASAVARLVDEAIAAVELSDLQHRVITTLSGGERQRAHFARLLVQTRCGEGEHGSGAVLLDEPTASLDLRHQLDLLNLARGCAARGFAVIAVLHDLNLASFFASRIVMLERGRIVADGPASATITDALVERVFGVRAAVGRTPPKGIPFVLPHVIVRGSTVPRY